MKSSNRCRFLLAKIQDRGYVNPFLRNQPHLDHTGVTLRNLTFTKLETRNLL